MMSSRTRTIIACVVAAVAGLAVAFFSAGVALFSDGPMSERLVVLAGSVVAFAALGAVAGALRPKAFRAVGLAAGLPVAPVALLLGLELPLLAAGFVLGDVAAALLGAWLGALIRSRR